MFGFDKCGKITCYENADFNYPLKFVVMQNCKPLKDIPVTFVLQKHVNCECYKFSKVLVNGVLDMTKDDIPPVGVYVYGLEFYDEATGKIFPIIAKKPFIVERWVKQ